MNSIFLRIYGGILLMVMLIGLLAYGSIQLTDYYRAADYRQRMAHGTFYLIAQGVERYATDEERQKWLQLVSHLVGAQIEIASAKTLELSSGEKRELADGQVVLRLDDTQSQADILYALPQSEGYIHTSMSKVSEKQARATALLVLDALGRTPATRWPQEMEELQQQFGFPLYLRGLSEVSLDREQTQRLGRREVVLAINNRNEKGRSSVTIYTAVGDTGKVLVMGPLYLFDPYPVEILALVGVLSLLLLALAAYFLVRPLQSRLGRLEVAIKQLGDGDLSARADVESQDAIGQLASTFNGMGQHIHRLIKSQREMTRAVSHELRTPVARLRFGLEMLAESGDHGQLTQRVAELDDDIDQLDELIDEILTFAKLEEGMPEIEFDAIDIPELMAQLRDQLQPISRDVAITISDSWRQLPLEQQTAVGERRYLHRILQNLVTNGVRYGNTRVEMCYRLRDGLACLEVSDDGEGIPEAERERIFEPFARLDRSRQRKSGGYGLGLSIVQRIAEWHGGRVTVADSKWGGACFRVCWPRHPREGKHRLAAGDLG